MLKKKVHKVTVNENELFFEKEIYKKNPRKRQHQVS